MIVSQPLKFRALKRTLRLEPRLRASPREGGIRLRGTPSQQRIQGGAAGGPAPVLVHLRGPVLQLNAGCRRSVGVGVQRVRDGVVVDVQERLATDDQVVPALGIAGRRIQGHFEILVVVGGHPHGHLYIVLGRRIVAHHPGVDVPRQHRVVAVQHPEGDRLPGHHVDRIEVRLAARAEQQVHVSVHVVFPAGTA